ncbi:EpsG family protein [Pectobacterium polaris]|uniref:EpsG family protein n=1 Tax=Pectobacterium polaris TaxID=2042057 RepID=UPI000E770247|nr:EpsG family protein [Pectobacterium polaris]RJL30202.1 hypothetical protein D5074_02340 [Pectobacterium polaris]
MQSSLSIFDFLRNDFFYILIDVFVFFVFIFYAITEKKSVVFFLLGVFFISIKLFIFVGLRPFDSGNDTIHYYYTFLSLKDVFGARDVGIEDYGNSEFLYWPFAAVFKLIISADFQWFLVFSIFLSALLVYKSNKLAISAVIINNTFSKNSALAVIMTYMVFISFEIAYFGGHIRSAFGVPLAFSAYLCAVNRKKLSAILLFFLSLGFHNSAISIAPLIILEICNFKLESSKKMTFFIVISLVLAFFVGRYEGIQGLMSLSGEYYSQRYTDYYEYTNFNITSVFTTGYFFIISFHLLVFLIAGYGRLHFYMFYYFFLILLFSSTPKLSERYFAYILICLPFLLYQSLRYRVKDSSALVITIIICFMAGFLTITSYGVISTLNIDSFFFPNKAD